MQLFFRDQISLIILNMMQISVSVVIYYFDQSRSFGTAVYIVVLNIFLLLIFLCFRYFSLSSFFQQLRGTMDFQHLDELILLKSKSPLVEAFNQLIHRQYKLYQNQIQLVEQKLDKHTVFLHQWIHQMKTPLSVIDLTIQDEDQPIFDSIRDEVDRLKRGLETVLFNSRLDSFEQDFHAEPVVLHQIVKQVITDYRRFFIRNKVYPEIQISESIVIQSDKKWISFIIGQLITNAVRYSTGISEKIVISSFERGTRIGMEIIDFGIGISKQDQKKVFQPYFTGENGRKYNESTGMGLYLVHEVCKFLNHEIELESTKGHGTKVRLLFTESIHPSKG